jgi:ribosomal protein S18 acetylase RimI-like enzyme
MYTIRELTAQDTEAFLQLKRIGLSTDPGSFVAALEDDPPSYPEAVRSRLARASAEDGDIVLGAFAPGLVGIVAITRDPHSKRRHKADLHGMYVIPEHRGRGLGKRLLVQALEMARGMEGLEEIQLIVAAHNREACALYERFGFVRVWTERHALKVGDQYVDAHHMVLVLRDNAVNPRASETPALTADR